jgi:hypothetical protein
LVRDPGGQGWRGLTNSIDEDQWAFSLLVGAACMILSFVIPKLGRLKGSVSIALPVNVGPTKQCPFCAETVKADAIVCKHCSRDISVASAAASR